MRLTLKLTLGLFALCFILPIQNLEAQKKSKKLKRPSSRVGISSVDKFVRESFNLYDKVYIYDGYYEAGKALSDDDYEILIDAAEDVQEVLASAPNAIQALDGAGVLKQGKGTLQINRAKKALNYSLRTAKKLLTTKPKKKDDEDTTEDTTVADTKTPQTGNTGSNGNSSGTTDVPAKQPEEKISYWMSYDFIPGKEVIFFDSMQDDDYGDFPRRWDLLGGNGEIARFGKERVLLFYNTRSEIKPLFKEESYLPDAFTIEFDIYIDEVAQKKNTTYNIYLNDKDNYNPIKISTYYPFEVQYKTFKYNTANYNQIRNFNGWHHIAISYHKGYLKMYFDEQKVLNIPRLDFVPKNIHKIRIGFNEHKEQKRVVSIKNFKIAKGGGKPYAQVIADGKFVTHGILFDVGKETLKAQSSGVFKRVMDMLIDNPDWKFEIVGHTDSDGEEASNLSLSKKRAEAVKQVLISRKIDASRLTTSGKGESVPVNNNNSPEEKANNRRVEFILKK